MNWDAGFCRTPLPTAEQLHDLLHVISQRVARFLERRGILERDEDNSYLTLDGLEEDPLQDIHSHSVTYRVAIGPQKGRKVFCLQTVPLHCQARHLPQRLSLTPTGKVRYQLKTPFRNGSTHVIFEPLDFIAKLAALVPKPRVSLTRFHGVFAPNSKHRAAITPSGLGKGRKNKQQAATDQDERTPAERHAAMTGFCSCKTGIHAIHGNNLDAAIEAGIQHRHRNLREVPGAGANYRLCGGPGGGPERNSTIQAGPFAVC
jgi:hypothetical protein